MKGVDPSCDLGSGVVLAGGGSSIRGIEKCFRKYLESNGIDNIRSVRRAAFRETDVPLAEHEGTLTCADLTEKMNPVADAVLIGLLKLSNDMDKTLDQAPKKGLARYASKIWDWFNKSM
jgi:cell division ATPase FtsA